MTLNFLISCQTLLKFQVALNTIH